MPRTAENLIGGFLGMIPGGNRLFEQLQESRVLEDAFDWISAKLSELNITWARISSLIDEVIDAFPTWSPVAEIERIFAPVVRDILAFIAAITEKILELIVRGALTLAGPYAERVWEVIQNARESISIILEDPLQFAKNLFSAVIKGFQQFGTNIWEHLKKGLMGWLFGAIQGLDIQLPDRLDFKGLISIGLQVVGLTYEKFRAKLVKKLGPNGERIMTFIETSVEVVKILVTEGFPGIWQKVLSLIDGFKETMIGAIRDFVIRSLVKAGIGWLAGLSNPVGAVIQVVLSIYNMIVTFIERINQILEVATSIFNSIGAIARGQIQPAADFVEQTIGRTIPIVISFLAALVPVTGIATSIRNVVLRLRGAVDSAIDKLLSFVVKKAKKLFSSLIAKLNGKRKLPSANFMIGKTPHQIYAKKERNDVEIYVEFEKAKGQAGRRRDEGGGRQLQGGRRLRQRGTDRGANLRGRGRRCEQGGRQGRPKLEERQPA